MTAFQYPEIVYKTGNGNGKEINSEWNNPEKVNRCNSNEVIKHDKNTRKLNSKQSPININTDRTQECHLLCKLDIHYKHSKCHILRSEQGIIVLKWDPGSYIVFNNMEYMLQEIHFHTPSMHHIDDNSSEMEILLYHYNNEDDLSREPDAQDNKPREKTMEDVLKENKPKETKNKKDNEEYYQKKTFINQRGVILSILVNHTQDSSKEGATMASRANMFMSQFIHNKKFLDLKKDKVGQKDISVHEDWSVSDLLPKSKAYYTYEGSIPFPPCLEEFQWVVFDEHIEMIEEFINIMRNEGNPKGYRDVHPLNNRVVFYNNNIEVTEEEKNQTKETSESKNDMVKNMLAPIRIIVDNRAGYDYRIQADKIINEYQRGNNTNYMDDTPEGQKNLQDINKGWDDLGKIGYVELQMDDIIGTYYSENINEDMENEKKSFLKNVVFDSSIYPNQTYLTDFISIPNTDKEEIIKEKNDYFKEENALTDFFTTGETVDYTFEQVKTKITDLIEADKLPKLEAFKETIKVIDDNIIAIVFILLEYDISSPDDFRILDNIYIKDEFMEGFLDAYFNVIKTKYKSVNTGTEDFKTIIESIGTTKKTEFEDMMAATMFKSRSDDLKTTINNHNCQTWGSNKTHHETNLVELSPNGYTSEDLKTDPNRIKIKKMIRDGLLDWNGARYVPNNKCRNPNNTATAPWCYTTDSKVRWDYCMKPNITLGSRKFLLVILFLLIIMLSYYLVRVIFRFEMFSKFIAALTGAKVTNEGGTGSQGPPGGAPGPN